MGKKWEETGRGDGREEGGRKVWKVSILLFLSQESERKKGGGKEDGKGRTRARKRRRAGEKERGCRRVKEARGRENTEEKQVACDARTKMW